MLTNAEFCVLRREAAARFYTQFDFSEPFPDDSRRLFVSLSSIQDHLL